MNLHSAQLVLVLLGIAFLLGHYGLASLIQRTARGLGRWVAGIAALVWLFGCLLAQLNVYGNLAGVVNPARDGFLYWFSLAEMGAALAILYLVALRGRK